jgi:phosphonate degradation associated HDIG domain protein
MNIVDDIFGVFARRGGDAYFGEPVSQLEHALQTAMRAEAAGAPESLVAAALLHDVGHLLHKLPEDVADRGVDGRHERVGANWLARFFPAAVTDPIRLHVAAKRYLCAVDSGYRERLSAASVQSLALQGGPMNQNEAREFESAPNAREAALLRRWDDEAKIVGVELSALRHYKPILERLAGRKP